MKKFTLMAATAISTVALAGTTLTTQAANIGSKPTNKTNVKFVYIGGGCDIESLLSQFEGCFPGIQRPVLPELPDIDSSCPIVPEAPLPNQPKPETPSPEKPDTETPSPEKPDTETPSPEKPGTETPSPEKPDEELSYAQQIINLVNIERAKENLAPLTLNKGAAAAAQVRAQEIVSSFSHTRPNGTSFATALKEQNISYRRAGENIAWGQKSPEEVVKAWMNSSGHRANIMNPNFTSIGVGYYRINNVNYWCQLFVG